MNIMTSAGKHLPEETADFVRELGGDDALIYGDLFVGKALHAMAFFTVMGVGNFDEEKPLAPQLDKKEKRDVFKAFFKDEADAQAALLVVLEMYCGKDNEKALQEFGPVLRVLWERDIVAEEKIYAWHENEFALREFCPKHFSQSNAEAIRESSKEFIQWLQAGED
mmetsp:Transcript_56736/g.157098  ORF Transcript_56736/g.157098 Transcript_56736/m.157098 type:complete len:166 (+) Transcript_56736:2-499(+)